jgi:hypothetical protein
MKMGTCVPGVSSLKQQQLFEIYLLTPRNIPQAWPIQPTGAHEFITTMAPV